MKWITSIMANFSIPFYTIIGPIILFRRADVGSFKIHTFPL